MKGETMTQSELLIEAVRQHAKYSVQYSDYDKDTWTAPCLLTHDRLAVIMDDNSVKKIRIELEKE